MPQGCVPGTQIACACGGGQQGTQICAGNGKAYEPCACPDASAGPTSSGGSSTDGSSSGASSSGGSSSGGDASSGPQDATVDDGSAGDATVSGDATIDQAAPGSDGASDSGLLSTDAPAPPPPCDAGGLGCYVTTTCTTSLSGYVYDPAGSNPLYNVTVFVPDDAAGTIPPITPGTHSCGSCGAPIGKYLAATTTDATGHFVLTGVPATTGVPVVVQVGKWRREVFLVNVTRCADNRVPAGVLRLPRKRSEGDMPQLALLTGGCDDTACFLLNMGIDSSEFGAPHSGGRVDVYQGNSMPLGIGGPGPGLSNGTAGNCTNTSCPLWASKTAFEYYDMALLSCQCSEMTGVSETTAGYTNLHDWVNEGGRVLASHYHYTWFEKNPDPAWQGVATWLGSSIASGSGTEDIDTSFPKGAAFAAWLADAGALASSGPPPTVSMSSVASSVGSVNAATTQRWMYDPSAAASSDGGVVSNEPKYLSFLSPIGGFAGGYDAGADAAAGRQYCGKAVFTDLHTSSGLFATATNVPADCKAAPLTAQQKALEFLFFDLSSCVSDDTLPPPPLPPSSP